jgi:hypothetical protein
VEPVDCFHKPLQKEMQWMLQNKVRELVSNDRRLFGDGKITNNVWQYDNRVMELPAKRADTVLGKSDFNWPVCGRQRRDGLVK